MRQQLQHASSPNQNDGYNSCKGYNTPVTVWRQNAPSFVVNQAYKICSQNSGKCLDLPTEGLYNNGTDLQQWTYAGTTNQKWLITAVDGGYFKVINKQSGKAMDIWLGEQQDGARIVQWDYFANTNQNWAISPVGGAPSASSVATAARPWTSRTRARRTAPRSTSGTTRARRTRSGPSPRSTSSEASAQTIQVAHGPKGPCVLSCSGPSKGPAPPRWGFDGKAVCAPTRYGYACSLVNAAQASVQEDVAVGEHQPSEDAQADDLDRETEHISRASARLPTNDLWHCPDPLPA